MNSDDQNAALQGALDNIIHGDGREYIITGSPGTGKSYLTDQIISEAIRAGWQVLLSATTHKAVEVVSNFAKIDAFTIHKILNLIVWTDYQKDETQLVPGNPKNEILRDYSFRPLLVVVDEASMVSDELYGFIDEALNKYPKMRILYVGDKNQLPPVNEEVPIVFNRGIPMSELTTIHRQKEGSTIREISANLKRAIDDETWFVDPIKSSTDIHVLGQDDFLARLEEHYRSDEYQADPNYVKALAYRNKTVNQFNAYIRKFFYDDPEYQVGERLVVNSAYVQKGQTIAKTESIVTLHENTEDRLYDELDVRRLRLETPEGVEFEAFITPHPRIFSRIKNRLFNEGKTLEAIRFIESFVKVRPIYASTVHKSQGSTYNNVFVEIDDICACRNYKEIARLIYVAITRAKDSVYIFGDVPEYLWR